MTLKNLHGVRYQEVSRLVLVGSLVLDVPLPAVRARLFSVFYHTWFARRFVRGALHLSATAGHVDTYVRGFTMHR